MTTFELKISETVKGEWFNVIRESFPTKEKLVEYIIDRYGRMPNGRNKVYQDTEDKPIVVGFLHSFWNRDISHASKNWYQTDWIVFWEANTEIKYFKL